LAAAAQSEAAPQTTETASTPVIEPSAESAGEPIVKD